MKQDQDWLTSDLKKEIRAEFEPLYQRSLNDKEVREIAINLSDAVEIYAKWKYETWIEKNGAKKQLSA